MKSAIRSHTSRSTGPRSTTPSTPRPMSFCSRRGQISAMIRMSGSRSSPGPATRHSARAPTSNRMSIHWLDAGPELGRSLLEKGFAGRITRGLHRTPKPIIAALNGWVIGGGIELALACDIRIASEHANFGFFHMRRGMHFADGGIVRLVNTVGVGIAMELELMGEPIDAQRAKEVHLVNRVVPHSDLMATAEDIAAKILRNPRAAVESAKQTILEVIGRPLDDQLRLECLYGYSIMGNPEIVERQQEFLERRDADRVTTSSERH